MDHTYKFFNKRELFLSHPVDDMSVMMSEVFFRYTTFVCNKCANESYRECKGSEIYGEWHIASIPRDKTQELQEDEIETDFENNYDEFDEDDTYYEYHIQTEEDCHINYKEIIEKINDENIHHNFIENGHFIIEVDKTYYVAMFIDIVNHFGTFKFSRRNFRHKVELKF